MRLHPFFCMSDRHPGEEALLRVGRRRMRARVVGDSDDGDVGWSTRL